MKTVLLACALLWSLGLQGDDGDSLVCTYRGYGRDPVYDVHVQVNCHVQIEAPGLVARVIVGNPGGFFLRQSGNLVWLQTRVTGAKGALYLLTANGHIFGFNLIDVTGCGDGLFVKKVVIVTPGRAK